MSIRRISELEPVTRQDFPDDVFQKSLFEISRFTGELNEAESYYESNSVLGSELSLLYTEQLWNQISTIISGDCEFYGTKKYNGNVIFNNPEKQSAIFDTDVIIKGNLSVLGMYGGNAYFSNAIRGIAMSAYWQDLAELYESDFDYEPGTLVKFGGINEITIADDEANAVITSKPGFVLGCNPDKEGQNKIYKAIALVGRVPVKVKGKAEKFQNVYLSDEKGVASTIKNGKVIGKTLFAKENDEIGLVECVVRIEL